MMSFLLKAVFAVFALFLMGLGVFIMEQGQFVEKAIGLGIFGGGFVIVGFGTPFMVIGLIIIVIAVVWGYTCNENEQNGKNDKKRAEERAKIEVERQEAIASQRANEPWSIRYSTSPCPHCGHYKVRYANWEDKRASIAFWGAASDKIGKFYKCENCNRMW